MKKETSKKEATKKVVKKPVEQPKKPKKVEAPKVAPKKETMSKDMVEKNSDDKIWIVIALLLVFLVGGAFIGNKIIDNKKEEASSNNKIYVSKNVTSNEDGTVLVKVKIKSKVGLKTVTLEDGTIMNYNGKTEVEIKFTATKNKSYKISIKDINGKKTTKEITVSTVGKKKEEIEKPIEVVEAPKPYVVYYYQAPPQKQEPTTPAAPVFNNISGFYKELTPKLAQGTVEKVILKKDTVVIPYIFGDTLKEEGNYELIVIDKHNQQATLNFVIDLTSPLINGVNDKNFAIVLFDIVETNLNSFKVEEIDASGNVINTFVGANKIDASGSYIATAIDKAGNTTVKNFVVAPFFVNPMNNMVFTTEVTATPEASAKYDSYKLEKLNVLTKTYEEQVGYAFNQAIVNAGVYKLTVVVNNTPIVADFIIDFINPAITFDYNLNKVNVNDDSLIKEVVYGWTENASIEPTLINPLGLDGLVKDIPTIKGDYYLWVKATDYAGKETTFISKAITVTEPPVSTPSE
ncbi:MAG: hypothetical protein RSH78_02620 [Bacilli bacterium]